MNGPPGTAGLIVKGKGGKATDVDIVGPNGEWIAVGGPWKWKKGANGGWEDSVRKLRVMQEAADKKRIKPQVQAYFAKPRNGSIPADCLDEVYDIVGRDNVKFFDDVE